MKWLILLITTSAFAQDICVEIPEQFKDIEALHSHMIWNGASDKQVDEAPCVTKTPPRPETIKALIAESQKSKATETVHGVNFQDEDPELIKHFNELTTARDILGLAPAPEKQLDIQNKFSINPECTKVECAVKKIWGDDLGSKILYIKLKHGFNASELAFTNSDQFTLSEINDVVMGLDDLPSSLIPLVTNNHRLTHFTRGKILKMNEGKQVEANASVMLFDLWDQKTNRGRQYTMFHELSHNVSSKFSNMDESPEWTALSGWIKKGDAWSSTPEACFFSEYGKTNPAEDWAEALSSYRYSGERLKKSCPDKYSFLKEKVFQGYEYTDSYSCSDLPKENLEKAHLAFSHQLQNSLPSKAVTPSEVAKGCGQKFTTYPPSSSEINDCSLALLLKNNPQQLDKFLKENLAGAGIADTERNRNILLSTMNEDAESKKLLSQKMKGVSAGVTSIAGEAFKSSLPVGMGKMTSDDLYWWKSANKCGDAFFKDSVSELKMCLAKNMADEDAQWQSFDNGKFPQFKMPEIFSAEAEEDLIKKRNIKVAEHLTKQPEFIETTAKKITKFRSDLKWHYLSATNDFDSTLKDNSPKEFCEKTYGTASTFLSSYGISKGTSVAKFQKWCESQEATKAQRFVIPETEWSKFTETILSK